MSKNETALLAALTDAAAVLWQMGATGAAHKAEMAIADATPFVNRVLRDDEIAELNRESAEAWDAFNDARSEE